VTRAEAKVAKELLTKELLSMVPALRRRRQEVPMSPGVHDQPEHHSEAHLKRKKETNSLC
jgi:hypothetical protein